jgi:hypothetical protein
MKWEFFDWRELCLLIMLCFLVLWLLHPITIFHSREEADKKGLERLKRKKYVKPELEDEG